MSNIVASYNRQQGNSIILKTNPIVGILALTSFVDDSTSTDVNANFIKTFRYTTNGVIYSDWLLLTVENILAITLTSDNVFVAELSYFQNQPSGSNDLSVTEAIIGATNADGSLNDFYFSNSIFSKYFDSNDLDVLNWYINVLEKLYEKGLIANYISREDINGSSDDYLAFWGAVAKFCAFYVKYARVFATFYNYPDLIQDFLEQRGLNISPQDSLEDMQRMLVTYYFQMSKRGTNRIIISKLDGADVDGEFLRLIFHQNIDEFLFCLFLPENFGWNLGNSSPLHKGLRKNYNLNKAPWSLRQLTMLGVDQFVTGSTTNDNTILTIGDDGGGIDVLSTTPVLVSPDMDYQISFFIQLGEDQTMTFDISGYDKNGNSVNLLSRVTGEPIDNFFSSAVMSRSDKFIQVKCYLYNNQRGTFSDDTTSVRQGQNLIADINLNKIAFSLTTSGAAQIKSFQITPMQTDYSRGFLQSKNFISTWLFNRNNHYSIKELQAYVSKYLIPYDTHIKITNIGDYLYTVTQESPDTFYWVGAGAYCRKVIWIGTDPSCEIQLTKWIPDETTSYCQQQ